MRGALLLAAVVAAAAVTAAPGATPAVRSLTVEGPVTHLAADGARIAFVVRHRFGCARVALWAPPSGVATLRSQARCVGGDHSAREGTRELALAGTRAAWVETAGGNNEETTVWTATLAARTPVQLAFEIADDSGVGGAAGRVHGDGGLLVFSTSRRCERRDDGSAIACRPGFETGEVDGERIWRVASAAGPCPEPRPRPARLCAPVRTTAEEQTPLAVDAGRIAVRRRSGTVELIRANGGHLARFAFGRGVARSAALHANDLVVARDRALDVFDVASGEKRATWPLPANARLQDVHGGVALYLAGGRVHLLRLADGAGERMAAATAAQLEGAGLFYASGRRITLVPRERLPVRVRPARR